MELRTSWTQKLWGAALALAMGAATPLFPSEFDWPQWLGLSRDARSKETGLLKSWSRGGPPLVWEVRGLGEGFSTPSIAGGRIFTMGNRDKTEQVIALDEKDGKELWSTTLGPARGGGGHPGPRCTPTVDQDLVYALGCGGTLVCLKVSDGSEIWKKELRKDFEGRSGGWEYSESPLVDQDRLIVTPGGRVATLAALHKKTGEVLWQAAVPDGDNAEYSSVIAVDVEGTHQYIQFLSHGVVGIGAADGRFLWRYSRPANRTANCSTPIYSDGYVFAASGYGNGGGLAKLTKDAQGFRLDEVYSTKQMKNHHGGMVLVNGYLYGSDEGRLTCLDFKTGLVKWAAGQPGKGSILYADGHLYYRNEGGKGTLFLIEATPEQYVEHGRFDQPGRSGKSAWPHPVIANGRLYVRDQDLLLAYDVKEK